MTDPLPIRVMADSCALDEFTDGYPHARELSQAIEEGRLELVATHVQRTENDKTGDEAKPARLAAVPRTEIGASVFVLGRSQIGNDRLGDGAVYNHVAKPRPDYLEDVNDGMIADTRDSHS